MSSYFGWLDYSEEQRKQMMDAVALLKEKDTRDELGLGVIRDIFADIFFPGTSTIQTAAKYFLFVPWVYMKIEDSKTNAEKIEVKARRYEIRLIESLIEGSSDKTRIIGNLARERLQRLPSNIYWAGLYKWKLRTFDGTQTQYHKQIDYYYKQKNTVEVLEEDSSESPVERKKHNWNINLRNIMPKDFLKDKYVTSLKLLKEEAEFLKDQILRCLDSSLIAFLIDKGMASNVEFPWKHKLYDKFPEKISHDLKHAENFSLVMHGASLLYNYILAEKLSCIVNKNNNSKAQELINKYRIEIENWQEKIICNTDLTAWKINLFWSIVEKSKRKMPRTKFFVDTWISTVLNNNSDKLDIIHNEDLRLLITRREKELKPEKLCRIINQNALENWSGASGTHQIDYRWYQTQTIINDILEGLKNER